MTENYRDEAASDAKCMVLEFEDQIIEQLCDDGKASDDFNNDYSSGDSYHHESHIDKEYDLEDAAAVLSQLREHRETDSGLWEGCEPEQAISAQAAYTYGNAVASEWSELIEEINDKWGEVSDALTEIDTQWELITDTGILPESDFKLIDPEAIKKHIAAAVIKAVVE